eukprot:scaffold11847_cov34-Attheya_sp.AAC.1
MAPPKPRPLQFPYNPTGICSLFVNAKIPIDPKRLALSAPSSGTLKKNLVVDGATDSIKKEGGVMTFIQPCISNQMDFMVRKMQRIHCGVKLQTVAEGEQLTLGIMKILGDGGLTGKGTFCSTAMQLLHGVYNLQANRERVNEGGNNEDQCLTRTIPAPIITRWWTIGAAAVFLLNNLAVIGAIAQGVINRHVTTKKANQIASGVQSLMGEVAI